MSDFFSKKIEKMKNWLPPADWQKIETLDAHTAGEPLRIILSGFPMPEGKTMLERRRFLKEKYDYLRTSILFEPRGHADQYGCILTPPVTKEADFGVLFLHNEGYSTMCGHAIIALTKAVAECGMVQISAPETKVVFDTPAGLVTSFARISAGSVQSVRFLNVPSFVLALNQTADVPGMGKIKYDIAFGGAFYAFVRAEDAHVRLTPDDFRRLIEKGVAIKNAVEAQQMIAHPYEHDLNFLYGTIFYGPALSSGADSRNVCVFAEGEVDRSPTGTGVSARMALHTAKGELKPGNKMVIESITGAKFTGSVSELIEFGGREAVIPQVEGTSFITGKHTFFIDPEDPFKQGFLLR